jgi:hypothetical protein
VATPLTYWWLGYSATYTLPLRVLYPRPPPPPPGRDSKQTSPDFCLPVLCINYSLCRHLGTVSLDMTNSIAGRKRKAGHFEGAVPDDNYPNHSTRGCTASSSVTRSLARYPGLCGRCARLDLDKILSSQHNTARGLLVTTLSAVSTWSKASCSFCRLMSDILNRWDIDDLSHNFKPGLYSYSSYRLSDLGWSSINKTRLRLGPTEECLVPQAADEEGPIRILKRNEIDFNILKGWVSICQDMHTKTCTIEAPSSTTVPFFKLIECETRKVISASNEPYVALSYVWGRQETGPHLDHLPEKVPQTIEDSITATLKLGFRYLWVDAYCINQRREEIMAQVLKMDLIYRNAQITIIACAGKDSDYGLPGVGLRERQPHPYSSVGKHLMVSALSDPRTFIGTSTWSSRA